MMTRVETRLLGAHFSGVFLSVLCFPIEAASRNSSFRRQVIPGTGGFDFLPVCFAGPAAAALRQTVPVSGPGQHRRTLFEGHVGVRV